MLYRVGQKNFEIVLKRLEKVMVESTFLWIRDNNNF